MSYAVTVGITLLVACLFDPDNRGDLGFLSVLTLFTTAILAIGKHWL